MAKFELTDAAVGDRELVSQRRDLVVLALMVFQRRAVARTSEGIAGARANGRRAGAPLYAVRSDWISARKPACSVEQRAADLGALGDGREVIDAPSRSSSRER